MNFAGCELDVVIGHPDHELLFVASQVVAAAGLHPQAVQNARRYHKDHKGLIYKDLVSQTSLKDRVTIHLKDSRGTKLRGDAWLFDEVTTYKMLLRGHAPQSEPFRKWVTEEVLPSIRKTGSYDITKSETPEAQQFAEEFGKLRAEIGMLTSKVKGLRGVIAELLAAGPAEHPKGLLWRPSVITKLPT